MNQDDRGARTIVDEILVDARALQRRGGSRAGSLEQVIPLLAAIRHRDWAHARPRLVGLMDHAADPLSEHHRLFFDEIATSRLRQKRRRQWFLSLAPMAHDPVWALPILLDPGVYRIASITGPVSVAPGDAEAMDLAQRADHLARIAWLGCYDVFAAVTQRLKEDLQQSRSIDPSRIIVSGEALRGGPELPPATPVLSFSERRHVAVLADGAGRDELAGVVAAHARSRARGRFGLVVIGDCAADMRGHLRTAYARSGGSADALSFAAGRDDTLALYREALLTVVPGQGSEAPASAALASLALGTPVVAPTDDGAEGIASALRYPRTDDDALARIYDDVIADDGLWERARAAGLDEARHRSGEASARRLLDLLVVRAGERLPAPALGRGLRPRLAMVTPLPPARLDSAVRSAATIAALAPFVEIDAFSDTPGGVPGSAVRSLAPVRDFDLHAQHFDASLSVLGNSSRNAGSFHHLLENGGAALTHDAHLVGFYAETFGPDRTAALGRAEQGGDVTAAEVLGWVREPHAMPTLLLSEVARAAAPLLVTSDLAQEEIARRYGIAPKRLPLLQYRSVDPDLLSAGPREALRDSLGWPRGRVALIASGLGSSAMAVVLWSLRLLRDWHVDARLDVFDIASPGDRAEIDRLARELDLAEFVTLAGEDGSERVRFERFVAADIAVQIDTHALAGPSDAVLACIAAALPTVANDRVARLAEAPDFVRRVPDALSPVLIAEAVLDILSSGQHRLRPLDEALAFGAAHAPTRYARGLVAALGLDCGPA